MTDVLRKDKPKLGGADCAAMADRRTDAARRKNTSLKKKSMSSDNCLSLLDSAVPVTIRTLSLPDPSSPRLKREGRARSGSDVPYSSRSMKKKGNIKDQAVEPKLNDSSDYKANQFDMAGDTPVGNLTRFLAVPPQLLKKGDIDRVTGSPKKGLLIFDASFESGNLGRVDCVSDTEYDLFVRPDTCNPKHRLWFNFTVDNVKNTQRVVFNFVNFSKKKSLFQEGMTPVYRTARSKWKRILPRNLYYYRSAQHGNNYVMSFAHVFEAAKETYQFAYCFPYSYADLQDYLSNAESLKLPYFKRELLALTVQQRSLDLLTISDVDNLIKNQKQRVVFITARVHPGETPSSYVCQGLLDLLLSNQDYAIRLRKAYVFKIVPMLNPDGVALGNYRCSLMGFDLNRHWQLPSTWAHPTISATKNLILQINSDPKMEVVACLDLHAHSNRYNSFFYGNVFTKDSVRCDRQLYLPVLLDELAPDYSLDHTQFNTDSLKAGTSRRALGGSLDESSLCLTLEVSFAGYKPKSVDPSIDNSPIPYTDLIYTQLGSNLGLALYQYSLVEMGQRILTLPRSFQTFISKKTQTEHRVTVSPNCGKSNNKRRNIKIVPGRNGKM